MYLGVSVRECVPRLLAIELKTLRGYPAVRRSNQILSYQITESVQVQKLYERTAMNTLQIALFIMS